MRLFFVRKCALAALGIFVVVGCSGPGDRKVDPDAGHVRRPLQVPPDLTPPPTDADLSAPIADLPTSGGPRTGQNPEAEMPPVLSLAKTRLDAERSVLTVLDEPGRAWRGVGSALERAGFVIEDRDRGKGLYYVRYNGAQAGMTGTTRRGVFSRWFGAKARPAADRPLYQVRLEPAGDDTAVRVLDAEGAVLSGNKARPLLEALYQQLK
jgi:outer membrane protein assembly factor BamC